MFLCVDKLTPKDFLIKNLSYETAFLPFTSIIV